MTPGHIHDSKVELVQVDEARVSKHAQLGEPKGRVKYKDPIQITAGVREASAGTFRQRTQGTDPSWTGFLVVRAADLAREAPGVTLRVGDRLTRMYIGTPQEREVDMHLMEVRPAGHQRDAPTMWLAYYQDQKTLAALRGAPV